MRITAICAADAPLAIAITRPDLFPVAPLIVIPPQVVGGFLLDRSLYCTTNWAANLINWLTGCSSLSRSPLGNWSTCCPIHLLGAILGMA